jgi:hypothetical protein
MKCSSEASMGVPSAVLRGQQSSSRRSVRFLGFMSGELLRLEDAGCAEEDSLA